MKELGEFMKAAHTVRNSELFGIWSKKLEHARL